MVDESEEFTVGMNVPILGQKKLPKVEFIPTGDTVLIEDISPDRIGSVVLPDDAKVEMRGRVIAVGPGRITETGYRIPMDYQVGDLVPYFVDRPMEAVPLNGKQYFLIRAVFLRGKVVEVDENDNVIN